MIRPATVDDAAAIAELYVRTRRLAYAPFFPAEGLAAMSVEREMQAWLARLSGSNTALSTVVAAPGKGGVAGFTHFGWDTSLSQDTGEVYYMYVATEHQGGGLGARLMAEAEAGLKSQGFQEAVLWVYEENRPARAFYERLGWQPDGGVRKSDSAPGAYLLRYSTKL